MNRRTFLKLGVGGVAVTAVSAPAAYYAIQSADPSLTSMSSVYARLDILEQNGFKMTGGWSAFQVFSHMAQSVEYSMTGYPEHKSELFKQTIGPLAFAAFSAKSTMRHNLSEAIPGAPALKADGLVMEAMSRFRRSLNDFDKYSGQLMPHFAYGNLSKKEYTLAHIMHFNDHMRALA